MRTCFSAASATPDHTHLLPILLHAWFLVFTFCGGPYRVHPAVHGRDLLAIFKKRHRQLYFMGKRHYRITQQRNATDSSIWKEPEDCIELYITRFWSVLHTQSHYFLLLTALTALNTWTIKTSWFPAIAGKVMSVENLSLAPLKPSALPLRWPEELEWVWWAVPCSDLIIFRPERNSFLTQGLWKWFMQIAGLSLDSGNLWLARFLEKILTFRENPHFREKPGLFGTWLGSTW